jgi:hypothetical protein
MSVRIGAEVFESQGRSTATPHGFIDEADPARLIHESKLLELIAVEYMSPRRPHAS